MKKKLLPLNHKYSVHSGVFTGIEDAVYMQLNKYGRYEYATDKEVDDKLLGELNRVDMMSDYSENEDTLSEKIFGGIRGIKHSKIIGHYSDLYAGYVKESNFRSRGTSGGFGTWLLCELLETGEIDGVIHPHPVDPKHNDGILFKYQVSRTKSDIKKAAKARYYPMELSGVLREVKNVPGKYAVVGISDFITELRLLCEQESIFKERIVYMIGLFNAHQKTTKYAEALAWQYGIAPGDLESIDFRVKNPNNMAWNYQCSFSGVKDGEKVSITKDMTEFPIHSWNMGFFKSRFSDFTDNAFNELADVTFGDAWLQEYAEDARGTNIVVVRNQKIAKIIQNAAREQRVVLDNLPEEKIIASQGMVSHIIHELPYRLHRNLRREEFTPKKRTKPAKNISFMRRRIQDLRQSVLDKNDTVYCRAVAVRDFNQYMEFVNKYNKINNRLYKVLGYRNRLTFRRLAGKIKKTILMSLFENIRLIKRKAHLRTRILKMGAIMKNKQADGAILTLSDDFNYGNVMQRYALQRFLRDNQLEFVHLTMYTRYLRGIRDKYLQNSLSSFVENNLYSRSFNAVKSVGYRNYVVGSDQVWRNHGTDDIEHDYLPYWFNFLGETRSNLISYAASFGVDTLLAAKIDDALIALIRPLLNRFRSVSVREDSGIQLVNTIAGRKIKAETVIDPTLLLKKDDYSALIDASSVKGETSSQMFCYILDTNKDKTNMIKSFAEAFNDDYQVITPNPDEKLPPVEVWLKGFRDADFVVTDSFHGVAFSIVNGVDFVVLANKDRGLTRVENLLSMVGISKDRLIFTDKTKAIKHNDLEPIRWEDVDKRLDRLRSDSGSWLLENVKRHKL